MIFSRAKTIILGGAVAAVLAACTPEGDNPTTSVDTSNVVIGPKEKINEPDAMFPDLADKRMYAATSVSYYFTAGTERMFADPSLTFRVLSYFEWLVNDVKNEIRIPEYRMAKLIHARDRIRGVIGMPDGIATQNAVDQFYAMSRFLDAMSGLDRGQSPAVTERRKVAAQLKARITRLIEQQVEMGYGAAAGQNAPAPSEPQQRTAPPAVDPQGKGAAL